MKTLRFILLTPLVIINPVFAGITSTDGQHTSGLETAQQHGANFNKIYTDVCKYVRDIAVKGPMHNKSAGEINDYVDSIIHIAEFKLNNDPETVSSVNESGKSFWAKYSTGTPNLSIVCTGNNHDQSSVQLIDPITIKPILAKSKSGFLNIHGTISVNEIDNSSGPSNPMLTNVCLYTNKVAVNVTNLGKLAVKKVKDKVAPAYCYTPQDDPFKLIR